MRRTAIDRFFAPGDPTGNVGAYPTVSVGSAGVGRFLFRTDQRFTSAMICELVGVPSVSASGPNKDIDVKIEHAAPSEATDAHTITDTATDYDLSGLDGRISVIADLTKYLVALGPGEYVAVEVTHNNIGGAIDYLGVRFCFDTW